jgi:hypothetical protein
MSKEDVKRLAVLGLISLVFFLYFYWLNLARPGAYYEKGWFGWYDQGQYLNMARDMASFSLPAEHYVYGLGYPILGAVFYKIYALDPFLIPNALMFVGTILLTYMSARKYLSDELSLCSSLILLFATPLATYVTVPWSSTVSLFCLSVLFYIASIGKRNRYTSMLVGICVAWTFSARFVDAVFLVPLAVAFFIESRNEKNLARDAAVAIISAGIILSMVLLTQQIYFGSAFKTPYFHLENDYPGLGIFDISRIPDSIFSVFINPFMKYDQVEAPLLINAFIFIFSPLGAISMLRTNHRLEWLALLIGFVLALSFYSSFIAFDAYDIKYGCIHYIKMWFPVLSILSVSGIFYLLSQKSKFHSSLFLVLLVISSLFIISSLLSVQNEGPLPIVTLTTDKDAYKMSENITITVMLKNLDGKGISGKKVNCLMDSIDMHGNFVTHTIHLEDHGEGTYVGTYFLDKYNPVDSNSKGWQVKAMYGGRIASKGISIMFDIQ